MLLILKQKIKMEEKISSDDFALKYLSEEKEKKNQKFIPKDIKKRRELEKKREEEKMRKQKKKIIE